VTHKAAGICVHKHLVYFHGGKPRIQWNCNHSQSAARIYQLDVLRSIREQEGKPITNAKALPAQCRRNVANAMMKLPESYAISIWSERHTLRIVSCGPAE
jgi:hypothetical protein